MAPPFNVAIIDPPWPYTQASKHEKLTGYSTEHEYPAMTMERLESLPIDELTNYVFLWTTVAFLEKAFPLLHIWGFEPMTTIAWVKTQTLVQANELPFKDDGGHKEVDGKDFKFKPSYGVGYWFRGCIEPIIVAKRKDKSVKSVRSQWIGLLSENAGHSRKPDTLYELIEKDKKDGKGVTYPGPYLELFGRRERQGWTVIGNEITGRDIADDIELLLKKGKKAA